MYSKMYLITQTDTYIPKHTHITQTIILFKVECLSNVCTKYKYSIPQTDTYIHIHPLNMSIQSHKQIHIFIYTHSIRVFNLTNRYIYSYTPTQYDYSISQTDTYTHIHT